MATERPVHVEEALATWRRKLLDLGRRNPLLYYRPRKASSLRVSSPDVFSVVDELDEDGGGWEVFLPRDAHRTEATEDDAEAHASDEDPERQATLWADAADDGEVEPEDDGAETFPEDVLVFEPRSRKDVETRLRNLRRRSETDLNERGVHVLYLAAGFLEWTDPTARETARSPLILFPVRLEQDSLFDPWRLSPAGEEEILVNPSLRQKLLQDFRLELPELPSPEEVDRSEGGELCRRYFADVRRSLGRGSINDWTLLDEGVLDLFSFHKLVMYRDLEQNASRAGANPVIRGLVSQEAVAGQGGSSSFPDDRELDRRLAYKDQFHVLDADSSQLAVLEAARSGRSLVLQGPPGTGKSQTISNLIAQSVADGRKVLFVSEKMAALEVVKKRLSRAGLEDLCLELHSHKTNRKLVVDQLARSLGEGLIVEGGSLLTEEELARLEERRRELRAYVEELHRRREPLGRSVGSALGQLATLASAPTRPLPDVAAVAAMDASTFVRIQGLVDTIAEHWPVVQAGEGHPWYGLSPETHGFQLEATLDRELAGLDSALAELRLRGSAAAGLLGVAAPVDSRSAIGLADLLRLVERSPGLWRGLFRNSVACEDALAKGRSLSARCNYVRQRAEALFAAGEPPAPFYPEQLSARLDALARRLSGVRPGVPDPIELGSTADQLEKAISAMRRMDDLQAVLVQALGLTSPVETLSKIHGLAVVIREILAGRPYVPAFFVAEGLCAARARLSERRPVWERGAALKGATSETFDDAVFDLELKTLVEAYRSQYQGATRFFRPAFYRDRKILRGVSRKQLAHEDALGALEHARAAQVALRDVSAGLAEDRAVFGELARGIRTDTLLVTDLLDRAERLLSVAPEWPLPPRLCDALCARALISPDLRSTGEAFLIAADEVLASLRALGLVGPDGTLAEQPGALKDLVQRAGEAASLLREATDFVAPALQAGLVEPTWKGLFAAAIAFEELQKAESALAAFGSEQADLLGPAFRGMGTDWDDVLARLTYAREIMRLTSGRPPETLIALVSSEKPQVSERAPLDRALRAYEATRNAVTARFSTGTSARTDAFDAASFAELEVKLAAMRTSLATIDGALAVARAEEELRAAGFLRNVAALFDPNLSAREFRNGIRRSILQAWVDAQATKVPVLQRFDGRRQDELVKEFRTLEKRFLRSGPARILDRVGDRTTDGNGGEVGLIRREAAKRRKHIPLRKLFAQAYTVIPKLKPCLLMSPLSVAQFLKDSPIHFDLVVFDEASQIFTEDAIGAVMRGSQLVVAGDEKQLPPTSFFQASQVDDSDGDDEDEDSAEQPDYESVLAACSTVLPQKMLRWHYRSRHEGLIAFSNARFYDSRLVTFPTADDAEGQLGVRWVHVSDGIYDRGKSRTNTREAMRIVDLVVEHWRNHPDESLGVVTLSQAQMDRVDDLLQERIKGEPELEAFYAQEGDERFFVKNLENVQGDERDHIILGIGYGKDNRGILTTGFGPLNRVGGERRLNVAITRAKRRLTAVASFRYSELQVTASSRPGVLQLQKFLEFAERGQDALETSNVGSGEAESPLEESVAAFLREKGFDVELQVGCSGFRIDLGVRDPARPGRFALGVECDGATYHSAATVRDRDRLRQSVLEGHGWRIHRIWGPDWVRRRTTEEARLLEAVRGACQAPPIQRPPESQNRPLPVRVVTREPGASGGDGGRANIPSRDFRTGLVGLTSFLLSLPPHEAPPGELSHVFFRLAVEENGIARERAFRLVANVWGAQRIGHRIRENFEAAWEHLAGKITFDGDFALPIPYQPVVFRHGSSTATQREFVHIPPGELLLAVRLLLDRNGVMSRAELEREVTAMYGCAAALKARTWLSEVLERGARERAIVLTENRVEPVRSAQTEPARRPGA